MGSSHKARIKIEMAKVSATLSILCSILALMLWNHVCADRTGVPGKDSDQLDETVFKQRTLLKN